MEKPEGAAAYNAVALCAVGAEKAVSNEIKKLGLGVTDSGFGRIRFRSDTAGLYRSLMGLRAADRVLLEAGSFSAAGFDALFEGTEAVSWERLIPAQMGLKVAKVRSNRSQLKAETSIQAVVHKAAAQRLCKAHGLARLPETCIATAEIRVYIEKDMVSLLLDLSGEPLFKRGYRKEGGIAPLRETTAAAMLLLSGWKRKYPLYDPFCGSGTILTEAFMYAWDMAPGLGRNFALNDLLIADNNIEETIRNELRGKINFERTIRIAGSDEDAAATALALTNLKRARDLAGAGQNQQEEPYPVVRTLPLRGAQPPFAVTEDAPAAAMPGGFIVTNPPYGKRVGDQSASERLYGEMAGLGRRFPQWKLALITDHPGFESFFGRKADTCREMQGGPIAAYFFQYETL
ncbi:MAG: class I SAM-dependent RNA methyltransferase [Treponema sp.]|nr:class I SAM-dependent RNA methyltransferase [Treponema sp.]